MTRTQRFGLFVKGAVFLGAVATLLVATPLASAQTGAGPDGMQIDQTTDTDRTDGGGGVMPELFYGPIPGFTTAAYTASETIAAPLGTLIPFHIEGLRKGQTVVWNGAESVSRDGLTATCLVNSTGPIFVTATIYPDQVDIVCKLDVIAVTPGGLTFDLAAPTASVFTHKRPTNSELVALYHNPESLAAFVVARGGSASTAVKRTLLAIPNDPKFSISSGELTTDLLSSLIEWRVDGKAVGVGSNFFETKGVRQIEVGPPGHATVFELTSYDVQLYSPDVVNGVIPTDRPITFTATTDPPGYEKNLRWIAATKLGSTSPSTGAGSSFTTTFQNALGDGTSVVDSPWFGVKVGNVGVGMDPQIPTPIPLGPWTPTGPGWTIDAPLSDLQFDPDFAGTPELTALLNEFGAGTLATWFKSEDAPVGDDVFQDSDNDGFVDPGLNPAPFGTIQQPAMAVNVTDFNGNPLLINLQLNQLAQAVSMPALGTNATLGGGTAIIFNDFQLSWRAIPGDIVIDIWMKLHILAKITTTSKVWSFHKDVKSNGQIFNIFHTGMATVTTTTVVHIPATVHASLLIKLTEFDVNGVANATINSLGQAMYDVTPGAGCLGLGDLNSDGVIDNTDVDILTALFGVCPSPPGAGCLGDLNGDGIVDSSDMFILLANFGPCP